MDDDGMDQAGIFLVASFIGRGAGKADIRWSRFHSNQYTAEYTQKVQVGSKVVHTHTAFQKVI